jgi:hypothetical protein
MLGWRMLRTDLVDSLGDDRAKPLPAALPKNRLKSFHSEDDVSIELLRLLLQS